jgi:hypothetical protein
MGHPARHPMGPAHVKGRPIVPADRGTVPAVQSRLPVYTIMGITTHTTTRVITIIMLHHPTMHRITPLTMHLTMPLTMHPIMHPIMPHHIMHRTMPHRIMVGGVVDVLYHDYYNSILWRIQR